MLHKPDSEPIYGVRGSMPFFKNDWNYFPKKKGRVKKLSFFHTPFCYTQLINFPARSDHMCLLFSCKPR